MVLPAEHVVKSISQDDPESDRSVRVILQLAQHEFSDSRASLSASWTRGAARRYHRARRMIEALNRAMQ
jgi:hypothetical protein